MNAVEIEQVINDLAEQPFDPAEFPYAFLEAFGNKATTLKRLRSGAKKKSDLGGVFQTNNIHIHTCDAGQVRQALAALKVSPATAKAKVKFILATSPRAARGVVSRSAVRHLRGRRAHQGWQHHRYV